MLSGHAKEAFKVYQKMEQEGLMPNEVTFLSMLQACAAVGALKQGYVEHRSEEEAFKLYSRMELEGIKPNKVTFLSMLTACATLAALEQGYAQHGCGMEALQIVEQMRHDGVNMDQITLAACGRQRNSLEECHVNLLLMYGELYLVHVESMAM